MHTSHLARLLLVASVVAASPACAGIGQGEQGSPPGSQSGPVVAGDAGGPRINWERPFRKVGETYRSVARANAVLPFKTIVPDLPGPVVVQTLPVEHVRTRDQVIALVYHLPRAGTVVVKESLPGDRSAAWMRSVVAAHAGQMSDPEAPPAFQMVELRGTEGMLVQGNGVGRIIWIEGGILFDITGPTVTPEQVMKIAETTVPRVEAG